MGTMKGYLINENGTHHVINFEDNLATLQRIVGGTITITRRGVGAEQREFLIVCDDEGLLKERKVTAMHVPFEPALWGNLLIVNKGDSEDFKSLTSEDVDYIQEWITDAYVFGLDGKLSDTRMVLMI